MKLRKFNNKVVTITDVDNQTFEGICLFEDKDTFDEEYDALSVKTDLRWTRLFEKAPSFFSKGLYFVISFYLYISIMLLLDNYEQNLVRFHF